MMKFIQKHMIQMRKDYLWGFDVPYMLTGILNTHPSSAINFLRAGRTDYARFYQELMDIE